MPKQPKQLNVRVDDETFKTLEAVAFAREESLPDVIRPYLRELAENLSNEPGVQTAIRGRLENAASREGKLSSLRSRRDGLSDVGS